MSVALGHSVTALLGEHRHQLLEGQQGFAQTELDIHFVALYQVCCERRIVERVVPVPTLTPLVVIAKDPLETLNVALPDSGLELRLLLRGVDKKLV